MHLDWTWVVAGGAAVVAVWALLRTYAAEHRIDLVWRLQNESIQKVNDKAANVENAVYNPHAGLKAKVDRLSKEVRG